MYKTKASRRTKCDVQHNAALGKSRDSCKFYGSTLMFLETADAHQDHSTETTARYRKTLVIEIAPV
jgi:hypothetical protein